MRVLICDDSKMTLMMLENHLKGVGYEVVGKGRDGEESFRLFQELKPDFILLDVTMPNRDGRECLMDIMKIDPTAKVIMISGLMDETVASECMSLGALAFIDKKHVRTLDEFKAYVLTKIESLVRKAA